MHSLLRHVAFAAVIGLAPALSGCGATSVSASLPSQSGTLANAAANGTAQKPRFNPFVENDDAGAGRRQVIENPTIEQVMQSGPLPVMSLGRHDAPITVIKYASMTCPYCRKFQMETFPILKKRFIDTGKMRFILREFPIGFQSGAATIALRCVAPEKYFSAYDALMRNQAKWVSQEIRREPIWQVVRPVGITREAFDACYEDKALIANLNTVKERGRTLGVIGTPNFFVNGKLFKRVLTMTDFDRIVEGGGASASVNR